MASPDRRFRWRTWKAFGDHLLEQAFDTPGEAGRWRAENFPEPDSAPLTLVAVVGERVDRVTPRELCDAQWEWLHGKEGAPA